MHIQSEYFDNEALNKLYNDAFLNNSGIKLTDFIKGNFIKKNELKSPLFMIMEFEKILKNSSYYKNPLFNLSMSNMVLSGLIYSLYKELNLSSKMISDLYLHSSNYLIDTMQSIGYNLEGIRQLQFNLLEAIQHREYLRHITTTQCGEDINKMELYLLKSVRRQLLEIKDVDKCYNVSFPIIQFITPKTSIEEILHPCIRTELIQNDLQIEASTRKPFLNNIKQERQ